MRKTITNITITTWFSDAEPISFKDGVFTLYTPDQIKYDVISEKFRPLITDKVRAMTRDENAVVNILCGPYQKKRFLNETDSAGIPSTGVVESYTFDNFVVGNSNRFAQAAATAVAAKPATAYNPLFIYGQSGLGKTHLLYAIANEIKKRFPSFSIVYIKGDQFTNELISKIQSGDVEPFRDKYRNADMLLVDDIQFVAGKERTQEEFFHTFNTLHEANKQVVLTSDRPPREMYTLEDRLKTRFEWGLIADIQPPDYETRIAIIMNKAKILGLEMDSEVVAYIAESIKSNVRQIEGAVKKICARNQLISEKITLEMAKNTISDILSEMSLKRPSPEFIINQIAEFFDIPSARIVGNSRSKELVVPRQIAMYLIRELTNLSLPDIGREFNRDHSTVHHAVIKIEQQVKTDQQMSRTIKDIMKNIENG